MRVWLAAAATLSLACATSPLGRSQLILVSDAEMDTMGVAAFDQMKSERPQATSRATTAYVTCVARAITDVLPEGTREGWEVRVFEDPTANAFALPGRKIGVHTGLLSVAENQDQLATVLGHEVAHVLARHGAERVSAAMAKEGGLKAASVLVEAAGDPASPMNAVALQALGVGSELGALAYGRDHESEADLYGLDLMAKAGFDPRESVSLWKNMDAASGGERPPEFTSTHPSPQTRIADLTERLPHANPIAERARRQGRRPSCGG